MFFSGGSLDNRELPTRVCLFTEVDDDNNIYGDRICNNGMACAISSILVAMMLMIVDLQIPCTNSTVGGVCVGIRWFIADIL